MNQKKTKDTITENIVWHNAEVTHEARAKLKNQKPVLLWFTGLSGSGKSTIANAVESKLLSLRKFSYLLDGDNVRHGLNKDLGFTDDDRVENIRRIGEVAKLFVDSGQIVLTAFISPFTSDREQVKSLFEEGQFLEVYIDTPIEICEKRDPKGLYKKARSGEIKHFTGVDSAYQPPLKADIQVKTVDMTIEECAAMIIAVLVDRKYI